MNLEDIEQPDMVLADQLGFESEEDQVQALMMQELVLNQGNSRDTLGSQEFKIDKENMNNVIKFNSSGDLDDISSDSESQASKNSNGAEEK